MTVVPHANNHRVVFITGASSGIGYAAALAFAKSGANVIVTARRIDRLATLETAVQRLPSPHGAIFAVAADVRDAADIQRAMTKGVEHFGHIDVLVANAGVGQRGAVVDSDWDDLETLLRTNIDGVLHSVRAAVPVMRKQGGGHIIIVSSVVANMTAPYTACYSASKAFVSSLANSLRLELEGDQITVTDMRVGRTATEFNEKRLGASGYAARAPKLPVMPAEKVGEAMVKAVNKRQKTVVLRFFDRLIIWANSLLPGIIGRRALKQYRV
ncbi:MAG: SDR family NAD(P)-dependent oxidoreductase [Anaerolineae bacterium]|nr:SDR family NAD(P)-dependent oxidoreductase [Anaerolineae bacterium]